MFWIDIIGISGSVGIAISFFPQTYESIKKKSTDGLSIKFILLILLSSVSMDIYSFYYRIVPMIITNVCVSLNSFMLLSLYIYERQLCGNCQKKTEPLEELEFV